MLLQIQIFATFLAILVVTIEGQRYRQSYRKNCPRLYPKLFKGYIPRGNLTSGNFTKVEDVLNINQCVMSCCQNEHCNVALMNDATCYHIACISDDFCLPIPSPKPDAIKHVSLVLVMPVSNDETWWDVLNENFDGQNNEQMNREMINHLLNVDRHNFDDNYINDMLMDETTYGNDYEYKKPIRDCEVGINTLCSINEECIQVVPKSRSGVCQCKEGYSRSSDGPCALDILKDEYITSRLTDRIIPVNTSTKDTSTPNMKQLTVSVRSKEVRLPENEVMLAAYVVPVAPEGHKYQYEWTLLKQPPGSPIKDQNEGLLHLSKLSEGLYTFKVSVSSIDAYGVTYANVTVLAPKRINQPPQVIINPPTQTVKLPNTGAVLDASGTKDDNGILTWKWELQQGPLGYQPHLVDTPTLQLSNLAIPGNYTFKVTVTDTDHATNSSTANITVLKITDYPPEANAGRDVIIYLPHNNVTLNGNISSDDRAIVTWEWTKSPSDADKAADMQDTRTPYLRLSDLEEGMYTFILKVTDSANQSSSSEVHVFVKPQTNRPPVAEAGDNITISLPQTWTILDGSNSKDDNKIVLYSWEQVEGPSETIFQFANISKPNVTGLTKGSYIFKLTVTDDSGNVASDTVSLLVTQNKNEKPKANAGGDQSIVLPASVIFINGSKSSDDLAITKWKWVRDDASLAIGKISKDSVETSILMLTDVEPGRYVFQLTVWDEQGLSDSDTVSVMVKEDPRLYQLVELTVEIDAGRLTESQFKMLQAKLALLVKDGTKLQVRELRSEVGTGRTVLVFYIETPDGKAIPATDVVHQLRQKLILDESLLGFSVVSLQTTICQNNCSGHGVCNEETRKCLCEAFWMQDLFRFYLGDGEADCKWSVLYVVVGLLCGAIALAGICWGCTWLCFSICTKRRMRRKPQTYSLLGDTDEPIHFSPGKGNLSESETDSDVLFESRNKTTSRFNGDAMRNGLTKANRNGFIKLGRRVKT